MADLVAPAQRLAILGGFADALADPCLLLDRRSVVLHLNAATAREFPAVAVGSLLALALRNPVLLSAIDAAHRTGEARTIELHQTVPNETWHRAQIAPLAGSGGLVAITLQNLTEHKRVEQLRSDFIANASHELRTPLASLVGFIDTLLGPAAKDEGARERFLTIMRQQAGRMSALIDDLLSLSRIEMRQHLMPTGSVDLTRLLKEVRDGLETQATEAGVRIELAADGPAVVTGDQNELYEVFENLIDNAIKYGGEGGQVELAIGPGRAGYDYMVSVTDHGAGIAADHVPRLTERFYRVDAESSRKKKGTGLGLAIVKHIVNRHRGLLSIRSKPGEGTRVDVLLNR
ncbi:MAG: GHKL domain-containing protein [Devosia nanyangense]|uniref:histidine kinase n=1 Tax=Devosia nanyangense TaxID=1228055 RepID=A0A933L438_9HYPH|nr:GHKL domain-containing protein [Devosia nanyangense]